MYKQIIIARKDLNMSPGKLAAQISHGSMAFLSKMIEDNIKKENNIAEEIKYQYNAWSDFSKKIPQYYKRQDLHNWAKETREKNELYFYAKPVDESNPYGKLELYEINYGYKASLDINKDLYEQWMNHSHTKCILKAKNKNQLLKAKTIAESLELKENEDFFLIRDNCNTELTPEENGTTLTVIAFKPMNSEIIDKIAKKFQLY